MTSCMDWVMIWLGIVVLGSSMFNMTVAIVCVISLGSVLGGWKGCCASCLQAWCIMVVTMFGSCGMVGSWVELCGLVSWYVVDGGGHLCLMLLLCSSSYRVQFGNMFWDACVVPLLHVRHVLLVLGIGECSFVWRQLHWWHWEGFPGSVLFRVCVQWKSCVWLSFWVIFCGSSLDGCVGFPSWVCSFSV